MSTIRTQILDRHIAIIILLLIGSSFAGAHIAARIAFDHGAGIFTAVIFRSGIALLSLSLIMIVYKQSLKISWKLAPWQLVLGLFIAIQSISIYSAVMRIPVGIALLAANTFPAQLALISWALGGKAPSRRASLLMIAILVGLLLALDIPKLLQTDISNIQQWIIGLAFSFLAAFMFSLALWITDNKLQQVKGNARSFYILVTILISTLIIGSLDYIPNGLALPTNLFAWSMLLLLGCLYSGSFITLFVLAPRLNMAQNSPAMNIEPIASLSLGWLILGQQLSTMQIIGGALVVSCIVMFAYTKK